MMADTMGAMPVYNVGEGESGGFGGAGGTWIWVFFLFFLLAWGGNGLGFGGAGSGAANMISNDFMYTNLNNTLDRGFTQIANQNYGIQKDLCQGFNTTQAEIANSRFAAQQCCCETNRNIDALRYENAKSACDIVNAIHEDGQATRALMTQNTIQELRDQLQAAQLQLGNVAQTQTLISTLRPFPSPAYITCSPYTAANGFGCGFTGCCNA